MSAPLIRGVGNLTIGSINDEMVVDLPSRRVGDILLVHVQGFNFAIDVGGPPETPPGVVNTLYTFNDASGFEALWAIRVLNAEAGLTLTPSADQAANVWATWAVVVTNVTPLSTWFDAEADTTNFFGNNIPAITVSGTDRLATVIIRGLQFFTAPGTLTGPGVFQDYPEKTGDLFGVYFQNNLRTLEADATTAAASYTHLNSSDRIFTISIIGIDDTPLPAQPQPGQVRLDCAESYTAFITYGDYRTRLDVVGWKNITWGRILDEASAASVVIPDITGGVRCCIPHGGIEPWKYGLIIERNDAEVWKGAIVSIGRDPDAATTTIKAQDVFVRYVKRFAVRDDTVEWVNVDAGIAFAGMINTHARSSADAWYIPCPSVFTGAPVTRHIGPNELTKAWEVLSDLLGSAVDAYIANGVLYVWEPGAGWRYFDGFKRTLDGPYNQNFDLVYGLFTAEAFTKLPNWDVDGMAMENFIAIPSADTGQFGFRQIWTAESAESQEAYGVLDHMEPNILNLPEDTPPSEAAAVLQARANTVRDLHAFPPVVISGGALAEGAPVDIDGLRPGSIWIFDIFDACFGQLRVASRLKSIEVSVTLGEDGPVETVSPTLYPPGFSGNEQNNE